MRNSAVQSLLSAMCSLSHMSPASWSRCVADVFLPLMRNVLSKSSKERDSESASNTELGKEKVGSRAAHWAMHTVTVCAALFLACAFVWSFG